MTVRTELYRQVLRRRHASAVGAAEAHPVFRCAKRCADGQREQARGNHFRFQHALDLTIVSHVTRAETLPVLLTSALALAAASAYLIDLAGFGVTPVPVLLVSITGAATLAWHAGSRRPTTPDSLAWAAVVLFVSIALLRLSWPALVPPGRGPDLAHHLLLVDYIEQHRQLVHDRSLDASMGEMAHYTPGAHVLAVLIGSWFGADGLRAFFPLLVFCTALTAGFIFLIGRRLGLPLPFAIAAVMLLFLAPQYFHGAFTHDSFLAQAVATFFAVSAWWALIVWDEERSTIAA